MFRSTGDRWDTPQYQRKQWLPVYAISGCTLGRFTGELPPAEVYAFRFQNRGRLTSDAPEAQISDARSRPFSPRRSAAATKYIPSPTVIEPTILRLCSGHARSA